MEAEAYNGSNDHLWRYIVGSAPGAIKTRAIPRIPLEERWTPRVLGMIGGVPWRLIDDDPERGGELMMIQISREVEPRLVVAAAAEEEEEGEEVRLH